MTFNVKDGVYYPYGCADDMSEGAYQAMCDEMCASTYLPPSTLGAPIGVWITRDGRVLKVSGMETKHLENAISFFDRAGFGDHKKIDELRVELAGRSK